MFQATTTGARRSCLCQHGGRQEDSLPITPQQRLQRERTKKPAHLLEQETWPEPTKALPWSPALLAGPHHTQRAAAVFQGHQHQPQPYPSQTGLSTNGILDWGTAGL